MFNCLKIKNERTYISNPICWRGLVYLKFPRLRPLVLWKGQQEKGGNLLHSFIGCQIPLHRQYNLHYDDKSVNVYCKTYTQHTRSTHTLLSTVYDLFNFICWYIQKHRRDSLNFAAVHLSLFFLTFEAVSQDGYGIISTRYFFIIYLSLMMEQLISLDMSGTNHLILGLQFSLELCVFKWLNDAGSVLFV